LNKLQPASATGKLTLPSGSQTSEDELLIKATESFKNGRIQEGRQALLDYLNTNQSRAEDIFQWMYDNLDLWGKDNASKDAAIIKIRNGMANLSLVGIPEINLSATLIELTS
jgi:hypothetical protein